MVSFGSLRQPSLAFSGLQLIPTPGLWTLHERRICSDLIKVYKIINKLSNVNFEIFFEFDTNRTTRGHSLKLKKKRFNTELRQHFFTDRIINVWNSLDEQIVSPTSGRTKKRRNSLCRPTGRPTGPSCACGCRALARCVVINPLGGRILTGIGYIRVHNHQT